jgi:hypothetical protein
MIDSTDYELVCALLQLRLLFKWARGNMSLRHATEAEGWRVLVRKPIGKKTEEAKEKAS